jgi:hypothetical protein
MSVSIVYRLVQVYVPAHTPVRVASCQSCDQQLVLLFGKHTHGAGQQAVPATTSMAMLITGGSFVFSSWST